MKPRTAARTTNDDSQQANKRLKRTGAAAIHKRLRLHEKELGVESGVGRLAKGLARHATVQRLGAALIERRADARAQRRHAVKANVVSRHRELGTRIADHNNIDSKTDTKAATTSAHPNPNIAKRNLAICCVQIANCTNWQSAAD